MTKAEADREVASAKEAVRKRLTICREMAKKLDEACVETVAEAEDLARASRSRSSSQSDLTAKFAAVRAIR